jgi:hypothetical protein
MPAATMKTYEHDARTQQQFFTKYDTSSPAVSQPITPSGLVNEVVLDMI